MVVVFIILNILWIIFIILLVMISMLLFIPFKYSANLQVDEGIYGKADVKWIFGVIKYFIYKNEYDSEVKMNIFICGIRLPIKKLDYINKIKSNRLDKKINNKRKSKFEQINNDLIKIIYNYIKDIVKIIRPNYFKISGYYGFDDPYLTGVCCGGISILNATIPNVKIFLEPVFEDEALNIETKSYGQVYLFIIAFKTVRLLLKKEIRNIIFKKEKCVKLFKNSKCIN